MKKRIFTLLVGLILLLQSSDVSAQETSQVVPGVRIRVTAPNVSGGKIVGTVVSFESDTLVLKAESQATPLTVPLASLKKLEVSHGRKSMVGRGALVGFLVGAGGGAIVGAVVSGETCLTADEEGQFGCAGFGALVGGATFGLLGTGIGAVVGTASKGEQWQEAPLEKLRTSLSPK